MASGTVYRRPKLTLRSKTYGYQLVTPERVRSISQRLYSTPTRQKRQPSPSVSVDEGVLFVKSVDLSQAISIPDSNNEQTDEETLTAIASAQPVTNTQSVAQAKWIEKEREFQRMVRRLQRPTTSYELYTGKHRSCREKPPFSLGTMPESVASQKKWLRKMSRPTTASSLKRLNACGYCDDPDIDPVKFDAKLSSEIPQDQVLSQSECSEIVDRLRTPTHAALHGEIECAKYPNEMKIKPRPRDMPLISGLKRSSNYMEITSRLSARAKTRQTEYTLF